MAPGPPRSPPDSWWDLDLSRLGNILGKRQTNSARTTAPAHATFLRVGTLRRIKNLLNEQLLRKLKKKRRYIYISKLSKH